MVIKSLSCSAYWAAMVMKAAPLRPLPEAAWAAMSPSAEDSLSANFFIERRELRELGGTEALPETVLEEGISVLVEPVGGVVLDTAGVVLDLEGEGLGELGLEVLGVLAGVEAVELLGEGLVGRLGEDGLLIQDHEETLGLRGDEVNGGLGVKSEVDQSRRPEGENGVDGVPMRDGDNGCPKNDGNAIYLEIKNKKLRRRKGRREEREREARRGEERQRRDENKKGA